MQDEYYKIIFGSPSPAELFDKLCTLFTTSPKTEQASLANQIPKLLPKYSTLPDDSVKPYLNLLEKILELLPAADFFAVCLNAFKLLTPKAYLQQKCQIVVNRLFESILAKYEAMSANPFFSQSVPACGFLQACFLIGSWIKNGVDIDNFSGEKAAPVQCVATFILTETLKDVPYNILSSDSSVEVWLGYLILLIETHAIIKPNSVKSADSLNRKICEEGISYMNNVLPFKENEYLENPRLFVYTDYLLGTAAEISGKRSFGIIAMEEYFGRFPERLKNLELLQKLGINQPSKEPVRPVTAVSYSEVFHQQQQQRLTKETSSAIFSSQAKVNKEKHAAQLRPSTEKEPWKKPTEGSDSDEDLKCLFKQLNLHEGETGVRKSKGDEPVVLTAESKEVSQKTPTHRTEEDNSSEKLSDMEMPCVAGSLQFSQDDAESASHKKLTKPHFYSEVISDPNSNKKDDMPDCVIECKAGMIKTLAYVDKEFLAKEFSGFVGGYVDSQDQIMQKHSEAFHKHFKHQ